MIIAALVPIAYLLWLFVQGTALHDHLWTLIILTALYVLITGVIIASVCGYMAGLIGASNSPIGVLVTSSPSVRVAK